MTRTAFFATLFTPFLAPLGWAVGLQSAKRFVVEPVETFEAQVGKWCNSNFWIARHDGNGGYSVGYYDKSGNLKRHENKIRYLSGYQTSVQIGENEIAFIGLGSESFI